MPVREDCFGYLEYWYGPSKERGQKVGHYMKDVEKLVITRGTNDEDKNVVYCRAYDKDGVMAMSKAVCGPDDIFDFNIGAKIAVDRMYANYDMTPKPKRKIYNGYVVFINTVHEYNENCYGCITYEVVNGLIPRFALCEGGKNLRIEENMTCSSLKKRIADMYFGGSIPSKWDKIMYSNVKSK